jgi:hypothetical protein
MLGQTRSSCWLSQLAISCGPPISPRGAHLLPNVQAPLASPSVTRKSIRPAACRGRYSPHAGCRQKTARADTRRSLQSRPDLRAGRPGEPPQVCSPKRPLRGEGELRPERSSQSVGGTPLGRFFLGLRRSAAPWIPPRSVPSLKTGAGFLQPPRMDCGIGASSGGRGHRGRASLYYERTRPPGTIRCWVTAITSLRMSDPDKYVVHRVNDVAVRTRNRRRTADTSRAEQVVWALFQRPCRSRLRT